MGKADASIKTQGVTAKVDRILEVTEQLIRVAGQLPTPQDGAVALASALGTLCASHGVDIATTLEFVELVKNADDRPTERRG